MEKRKRKSRYTVLLRGQTPLLGAFCFSWWNSVYKQSGGINIYRVLSRTNAPSVQNGSHAHASRGHGGSNVLVLEEARLIRFQGSEHPERTGPWSQVHFGAPSSGALCILSRKTARGSFHDWFVETLCHDDMEANKSWPIRGFRLTPPSSREHRAWDLRLWQVASEGHASFPLRQSAKVVPGQGWPSTARNSCSAQKSYFVLLSTFPPFLNSLNSIVSVCIFGNVLSIPPWAPFQKSN